METEIETPAYVNALKIHFKILLACILNDLTSSHNTLHHLVLRTIGYYMTHPKLSLCFTATHISSLLELILSRVYSTVDELTFCYCIWICSIQQFGTRLGKKY